MSRAMETMKDVLALRRNGYSGPFFLALMMLGMGTWLILPLNTFVTSESYTVMADFASEEAWGAALSVVGFMLILASLTRRPDGVAWAALMASALWLIVAFSFIVANPASAMVPILVVLSARGTALFHEFMFHFARDHPHYDRDHPSTHGP